MVLGLHGIRTAIFGKRFCLSVCMYVCVCVCLHMPAYIYIYIYICVCVCMCVCVCLYVCVYICVCICMCVCVYICVYVYIYNIVFIICLCLIFIVLCISFLILFTSRHFPLPLFRKCIWSHANIWNAASFCNSLQSLAIDCICRELYLGCLHWLCMRFWLFCFKGGHWFVNAVVKGLIQQRQIATVWFVYLLFYW